MAKMMEHLMEMKKKGKVKGKGGKPKMGSKTC